MSAMEEHLKAGLGAESVGDNDEKSHAKEPQDVLLQVPEKTWTDPGAEKRKMGKTAFSMHGP